MAMYEELCGRDIIAKLGPNLGPGRMQISSTTGKIVMPEFIAPEIPWIVTKIPQELKCRLPFSVFFQIFGNDIGMPPIVCQGCYKVVVRPRNLDELFKLQQLQEDIFTEDDRILGCKLGIEKRLFVHGLYGGYFYNRGWAKGKSCYNFVRKVIDKEISPEVPVILKRACTEMEMKFGDSRKWEITDRQRAIEQALYSCFQEEPVTAPQPDYVKIHIMRTWVEWACMYGDSTYLNHTDKPIHAEYIHYHDNSGYGEETI